MPRKSTLAVVLLLGILFAVGYAEAAERGTTTRTPSVRSIAATEAQFQSAGSLSLSKILQMRFLSGLQLLANLDATQPEPPVFGTNGLSDGPDPIDGSGQAGSGPPPPVADSKSGGSQDDGDSNQESGSSMSLK